MLALQVAERNRHEDAEQATAVAGFLKRIGQEQTADDLHILASTASQQTDPRDGEALFLIYYMSSYIYTLLYYFYYYYILLIIYKCIIMIFLLLTIYYILYVILLYYYIIYTEDRCQLGACQSLVAACSHFEPQVADEKGTCCPGLTTLMRHGPAPSLSNALKSARCFLQRTKPTALECNRHLSKVATCYM